LRCSKARARVAGPAGRGARRRCGCVRVARR
jgi:hypothetical protein